MWSVREVCFMRGVYTRRIKETKSGKEREKEASSPATAKTCDIIKMKLLVLDSGDMVIVVMTYSN